MNIYTLVLDTVNNEPFVATYTDPVRAVDDAVELSKQYQTYVEHEVSHMYFMVVLDDKGSRIYIKETEIIGVDDDQSNTICNS